MSFFYEVAMYPKLLLKREQAAKKQCCCSISAGYTSLHFHSLIELYLVEEGEVDVWINHNYKRLSSGEFAVSLSYDAHSYSPIGHAKITFLIVPPSACREFQHIKFNSPFINDFSLFENIRNCCTQIALQKNDLLTDGYISIVFGMLLDRLDFTEREQTVENDNMSRVLLYLHDHFKKTDLTLASTAAALGFNASYLSRQFKAATGIGLNNYVAVLRLRNAILLLQKGAPIAFSAYESGFNSMRTFYRAFSAEFGCSPKEYLLFSKNL